MSQIVTKWIADGAIIPAKVQSDGTFTMGGLVTGPIGIRTSSPQADLHVADATAAIRLDSSVGYGRNYQVRSDPAGIFAIKDVGASADRMTIDRSGTSTFFGDATFNGSVFLNNPLVLPSDVTCNNLRANGMLTAEGPVGVGTTVPSSTVDVWGAYAEAAEMALTTGASTDASKYTLFQMNDISDTVNMTLWGANTTDGPSSIAGIPVGNGSPNGLFTVQSNTPLMLYSTTNQPIYFVPNSGAPAPALTVTETGIGINGTPGGSVGDAIVSLLTESGTDRSNTAYIHLNDGPDNINMTLWGANTSEGPASIAGIPVGSGTCLFTIQGDNGPLMLYGTSGQPIYLAPSASASIPTVSILPGQVGINTSPSNALDIYLDDSAIVLADTSSASSALAALRARHECGGQHTVTLETSYFSGNPSRVGTLSDDDFSIIRNGGNMIYLSNTGVGIGTTTVSNTVDVFNTDSAIVLVDTTGVGPATLAALRVQNEIGGNHTATLETSYNFGSYASRVGTTTGDNFSIITNNADRILVKTNGAVGMGTTNASNNALDIYTEALTATIQIDSSGASSALSSLRAKHEVNGSHTVALETAYSFGNYTNHVGTLQNDSFSLMANSSDYVTLKTNGNVGFGTTNPSNAIDAYKNGTVIINADSTGASSAFAAVRATHEYSGSHVVGLQTYYDGFGGYFNHVGTLSNHDFSVVTNGSDKITISKDGTVGITNVIGGTVTFNGTIGIRTNTSVSTGFSLFKSADDATGVISCFNAGGLSLIGKVQTGAEFCCNTGATGSVPQGPAAVDATATEINSAIQLLMQIRNALVANGICQ